LLNALTAPLHLQIRGATLASRPLKDTPVLLHRTSVWAKMTYIAYEEYHKIIMQMLVNFYLIYTSEFICKIQSNIYDRIELQSSYYGAYVQGFRLWAGGARGDRLFIILVAEGQMYYFFPNEKYLPLSQK